MLIHRHIGLANSQFVAIVTGNWIILKLTQTTAMAILAHDSMYS